MKTILLANLLECWSRNNIIVIFFFIQYETQISWMIRLKIISIQVQEAFAARKFAFSITYHKFKILKLFYIDRTNLCE